MKLPFSNCKFLIAKKNINRIEEVKKFEGSGFGCSVYGFLDGLFIFLQKVVSKAVKDQKKISALLKRLEESGLNDLILQQLTGLNQKSDISPKGFIAMLTLIHDVTFAEFSSFSRKIYQEGILRVLCSLIKESQLLAVQEWPVSYGGGAPCVNLLISQLFRIFNLPYTLLNNEKEIEAINKIFSNSEIVSSTIGAFRHLQKEHIGIGIIFLSRLIMGSDEDKKFVQQFVEAGGFTLIRKNNLLSSDQKDQTLIEVLNIVSQLARLSKAYYEGIHQLNCYKDLQVLMKHPEANIRAKACNFIGNICRHSEYFYEVLLKNDLIKAAIEACNDEDKNVRKFACFAVGNAGFHNDRLYESLRPSVPLLVQLLKDPEEKTRANAAGALGNFVRNSNALTKDLIRHGALVQLLDVVATDNAVGNSPRRIALFSIGNLCAYPECRKIFEELNIRPLLEQFKAPNYKDNQVIKYAARIIQKLSGN